MLRFVTVVCVGQLLVVRIPSWSFPCTRRSTIALRWEYWVLGLQHLMSLRAPMHWQANTRRLQTALSRSQLHSTNSRSFWRAIALLLYKHIRPLHLDPIPIASAKFTFKVDSFILVTAVSLHSSTPHQPWHVRQAGRCGTTWKIRNSRTYEHIWWCTWMTACQWLRGRGEYGVSHCNCVTDTGRLAAATGQRRCPASGVRTDSKTS